MPIPKQLGKDTNMTGDKLITKIINVIGHRPLTLRGYKKCWEVGGNRQGVIKQRIVHSECTANWVKGGKEGEEVRYRKGQYKILTLRKCNQTNKMTSTQDKQDASVIYANKIDKKHIIGTKGAPSSIKTLLWSLKVHQISLLAPTCQHVP